MKHRILVAGAAFALLSLIASNPALARQRADKDSWWQCDQSFTIKPDGFHSVLVRFVSTDGKLLREEHHLQGNGLRANWAHHPKVFRFRFPIPCSGSISTHAKQSALKESGHSCLLTENC
jgi:hypothetical protein